MTSSPLPSLFQRVGILGLGLASTALTLGTALAPVPAQAQAPGGAFYRAELVQPAAQPRAIAGDLVWSCSGTRCVANKGTSRPLRICRDLNRKFGQLAAFSAKGEALSPAELAKCNA